MDLPNNECKLYLQETWGSYESCSTKILWIFEHEEKVKMANKYTDNFFQTTKTKSVCFNFELGTYIQNYDNEGQELPKLILHTLKNKNINNLTLHQQPC